jgi:hypothetical protein
MYKSSVDHILNGSSYVNKKDVVPVRSPFLWFRTPKKTVQPTLSSSQPPCPVEMNGKCMPTAEELRNWVQEAESVSPMSLEMQLLQGTWEGMILYYCELISRKILRAAYFTQHFQESRKLCLSNLV